MAQRPWHSDSDKIRALLKRHGISAVYHFTAVDNLRLIFHEGELCSKAVLETKGLLPSIITGGNQLSLSLDQFRGNYDKVSLSYCPKIPMAFHTEQKTHLCYIVVDPDVCCLPGTIFTDKNATDNQHRKGEGLAGLQMVDFNAVHTPFPYPSQEVKKKKQAEVLVLDRIPAGFFREVIFATPASMAEAKRNLKGLQVSAPLRVDSTMFIRQDNWPLDFRLTAQHVTRENVHALNFSHAEEFRITDKAVTLVVKVRAMLGTKQTITWRNGSDRVLSQNNQEFSRTNRFFSWDRLSLEAVH